MNNWYKNYLIKTAQIWKVNNKTLSECIYAFYELEYKYTMVKKSNIKGADKRIENILNHIKQELSIAIKKLKDIMVPTLEWWLFCHKKSMFIKIDCFDKYRKNIQYILNLLNSANDINSFISAISLVINTMHKCGTIFQYTDRKMLDIDFIGLKNLLDHLTNGLYIEQWNKELNEIGIETN